MYFIYLLFFLFIISKQILAAPLICSMCTVAVASGLGLAKLLGVDNTIIGLWTGAVLLICAQWTVLFLNKKNINNKFINLLIYISSYLLIVPLYIGKEPKIIFNEKKIFFIDSFLFSIIIGSLLLFCSTKLYQYMKNKNGKPHFPFEKVVLPVFNLIIISIVFHLVTK